MKYNKQRNEALIPLFSLSSTPLRNSRVGTGVGVDTIKELRTTERLIYAKEESTDPCIYAGVRFRAFKAITI